MKIIVVGNYFYPEHIGGIEIVTSNLARCYRDDGHQVLWVAADVPPIYRKATRDDLIVRSWNITEEKFGFPQPIPLPGELPKLYRAVRWADVVHIHDVLYLINITVFLLCKALGKPVLITQHTEIIPYQSKWKHWLQKNALHTVGAFMHAFADRTTFISTNTRDHLPFMAKRSKDPVVIPNGVDTDFYRPYPLDERRQMRQDISGDPATPLLLFVGRFVAIKGVRLLIPIIKKHPEWHWLLVGRPDEYNPSDWGCSNITFWSSLGPDGLRKAYAAADISIHPSSIVGMSLTIPESMACGTPVMLNESVLYEVPNEDRDNFILVDLDTEKMESTISALLNDRTKLASYAAKARNYAVSRSGWREIARQYLTLLADISSKD